MSDDDPITSEHLTERVREELDTAEHAALPAEEDKARRRADKTAYLRDKIVEQERADRGE